LVVVKGISDQAVAALRPLVIFGVMLIAIGIAAVAIDNISFKRKEVVIATDPLKVTAEQRRNFPILSVAGVIAMAVGGGMVFLDRQARRR
jgi:hypothetical protein